LREVLGPLHEEHRMSGPDAPLAAAVRHRTDRAPRLRRRAGARGFGRHGLDLGARGVGPEQEGPLEGARGADLAETARRRCLGRENFNLSRRQFLRERHQRWRRRRGSKMVEAR
jgi:hypothetical protein